MNNEKLAAETLVEAGGYIVRVLEAIDQIAYTLLTGQENVAMNNFVGLVDGLEWLINVINLTKSTQIALGLEFADYSNLINAIHEMVSAFENNDYVLLGDLLSYEVKPVLEKWSLEFQKLEEGSCM